MRRSLIVSLILTFLTSFAHGAWYEKASDNFDRANENPLASPWTTITGCYPMQIVDNMASATYYNASNGSIYTGVSFGDNQYSQAYVAGNPASSYHRLEVRVQAGSESGYRFTFGVTDTYLYRVDNGTATQLGSAGTTATKTAGDLYRIEVTDNVIKCFRNGVELHSETDNTYTSGSPSVAQYNSATSGLDNWSGGDDAGSPPPAGTGGRSRRVIFIQ